MHDNFDPKDIERVHNFCELWTADVPVAMELRKTTWYTDDSVADQWHAQLEKCGVIKVLVDTAARRDMMHMRLTSPTVFLRWVGCNDDEIDHARLDGWITRLAKWKKEGMSTLYFFVHQNVEKSSPKLAAYFIERLNKKIGTKLHIPATL
jgi:uncharacterized protein YecE (DUF72 family)